MTIAQSLEHPWIKVWGFQVMVWGLWGRWGLWQWGGLWPHSHVDLLWHWNSAQIRGLSLMMSHMRSAVGLSDAVGSACMGGSGGSLCCFCGVRCGAVPPHSDAPSLEALGVGGPGHFDVLRGTCLW